MLHIVCHVAYFMMNTKQTRIFHAQFLIKTEADDRFERQGDDLLLNHTISLLDALVGFSHEVRCVGVYCGGVLWGVLWGCRGGVVGVPWVCSARVVHLTQSKYAQHYIHTHAHATPPLDTDYTLGWSCSAPCTPECYQATAGGEASRGGHAQA